jgi:hypothetical protein
VPFLTHEVNRSRLLDDESTPNGDHMHMRGEVCDRDLVASKTSRMESKLETSLSTIDLRFEVHAVLEKRSEPRSTDNEAQRATIYTLVHVNIYSNDLNLLIIVTLGTVSNGRE